MMVFPAAMAPAVQDYKKLQAEYAKATDPTVKAAYKCILDKKIVDLRAALDAYVATVTTAINALQTN